MTNPSGTILEELNIDKKKMFSDPTGFAEECIEAGEELKAVLREDKSLNSFKATAREESKCLSTPDLIKNLASDMYRNIDDNFEPSQIYQIIDYLKDWLHDLEWLAENKIVQHLTVEQASVMDKRLAHQLYIKLYKMYGHYLETVKIIDANLRLPTLKALPGNYGQGLSPLKSYYYYFDDTPEDDPILWHKTVIRRLGLEEKLSTFMDLMEYIEANPNCGVIVREKVS